MSVHLRHRRPLLISALMMITLFFSIVPVTGAQSSGNVDWFGWGVKVDFQNNTWKVDYVTYLGSNSPSPHIVREIVDDISADCRERSRNPNSKLTYPTGESSARFDGNVYLECPLPSVRDDLLALGYTPPRDGPFCICTLGGAPFWVDGQVRHLNTPGTMPLLDASDRGVRVDLQVNGTKARTKLDVTSTPGSGPINYTSPEWTIDPAGNRTLMGWHGKKIVLVADHYHWLDYLADKGWRSFFQTKVSGSTIGSWNESSTTTVSDTKPHAGDYQMGMNAGTLYIGYNSSTGQYFTGDIERVGTDPGCDGT